MWFKLMKLNSRMVYRNESLKCVATHTSRKIKEQDDVKAFTSSLVIPRDILFLPRNTYVGSVSVLLMQWAGSSLLGRCDSLKA